MSKVRTVHRCGECGAESAKWSGRCTSCGAWNTLTEERPRPVLVPVGTPAGVSTPIPIGKVDAATASPRPTTLSELDRVLGGGFTPGSVSLLGGEPGIGKSTLLLQALARLAGAGSRCLLVSAEESMQQVRLRAERLEAVHPDLWVVAESSVPAIVAAVEAVAPDYVVIDSIQTVFDPETGTTPGTVTQIRDCATALVQLAKSRQMATVLVGHVTKDGALAGPRVLEHVVDTVLSFEGDRHHALRLLRATKHRFGPTGELGLFEMTDGGLVLVPDASGMLLADRRPGVPGSVVVPTVEGQRTMLVEVQALVGASGLVTPRRTAHGLDGKRLALLCAVLHRRAGVQLQQSDVFASAVGGVRVVEPAVDLGIALAIASATFDIAVPGALVTCGEVGLGGELRQVPHTSRRLEEAARLGFRAAAVPWSAPEGPQGMKMIRAATLSDLIGRVVRE